MALRTGSPGLDGARSCLLEEPAGALPHRHLGLSPGARLTSTIQNRGWLVGFVQGG